MKCGAMGSEGLADLHIPSAGNAKAYNRIKLITGIVSSAASLAFLWVIVAAGFSRALESLVHSRVQEAYLSLFLFAVIVGLLQSLLTLPMAWYSGYAVEHRYALSNQSLGRWAWEKIKGALVALPIVLAVLALLFFCLSAYGNAWWLPVSVGVTLLSVVLARLAPILIMPMFYKFTPLPDGSLKERITRLCERTGLRFSGIFSFNLSKNTRKANAGFTGIGAAKRIILGDTLVGGFTEEEIETVFAHELGHYRHHHILIGIVVGTVSTFAGLYLAARLYEWSLAFYGFSALQDIAALPLLAVWLSLFGLVTAPLGNMLSRRHERQADAFAVQQTGLGPAFAGALRKLASMNLADPEPHPLVEFLFYSHPSIGRRLRAIEAMSR